MTRTKHEVSPLFTVHLENFLSKNLATQISIAQKGSCIINKDISMDWIIKAIGITWFIKREERIIMAILKAVEKVFGEIGYLWLKNCKLEVELSLFILINCMHKNLQKYQMWWITESFPVKSSHKAEWVYNFKNPWSVLCVYDLCSQKNTVHLNKRYLKINYFKLEILNK